MSKQASATSTDCIVAPGVCWCCVFRRKGGDDFLGSVRSLDDAHLYQDNGRKATFDGGPPNGFPGDGFVAPIIQLPHIINFEEFPDDCSFLGGRD